MINALTRHTGAREAGYATDLTDDLDWPGQAQVVRLERTWSDQGRRTRARHY